MAPSEDQPVGERVGGDGQDAVGGDGQDTHRHTDTQTQPQDGGPVWVLPWAGKGVGGSLGVDALSLSGDESDVVRFAFPDKVLSARGEAMARASGHLRSMLDSGMREAQTHTVEVEGLSREAFQAFIAFAHAGSDREEALRALSGADGRRLWDIADMYLCEGLRGALEESVGGGNLLVALGYAAERGDEELAALCRRRAVEMPTEGLREVLASVGTVDVSFVHGILSERNSGGAGWGRHCELRELLRARAACIDGDCHKHRTGSNAGTAAPPERTDSAGRRPHAGGAFAPWWVAVFADGGFVCTSKGTGARIHIFGADGELEAEAMPGGHYQSPSGVAVSSSGEVFVCDRDMHKVLVYTRGGALVRQFGTHGPGQGQLEFPCAVAIARRPGGGAEEVFVCDTGNFRVCVFSLTGEFVREILGPQASGKGEFMRLGGISVGADGRIAISDYDLNIGDRVLVLDAEGALVRTLGLGELSQSTGVALTKGGEVVVADSDHKRLLFFGAEGELLRELQGGFAFPEGLAVAGGRVFVCDFEMHCIKVLGPDPA